MKESDEHRHNLINFDSKRYIELGCRGFPKDSLEFTIFHGMEMKGMEGKRNRLEVKGVTVVPRGFKMAHLFEFDYEPKEEDISMNGFGLTCSKEFFLITPFLVEARA